jgi:molybdate transport system substrate-binding protein
MKHRGSVVALTLLVVGLVASGCQLSEGRGDKRVTVLAASSLTESFTTIAADFEAEHPGTDVALSFGSSSTLATQVTDGAAADVIATASPGSMQPVVDEGLSASQPVVFIANSIAVALPQDNPAGLHDLGELDEPNIKVAVCVKSAPCGGVAAAFFEAAGLSVIPVTEEVDVKTVLAKVIAGEVDAGVVYASDVHSAGSEVTTLPVPSGAQVTTDYLIASLATSADPTLANDFIDAVESTHGQQVLDKAGFTSP